MFSTPVLILNAHAWVLSCFRIQILYCIIGINPESELRLVGKQKTEKISEFSFRKSGTQSVAVTREPEKRVQNSAFRNHAQGQPTGNWRGFWIQFSEISGNKWKCEMEFKQNNALRAWSARWNCSCRFRVQLWTLLWIPIGRNVHSPSKILLSIHNVTSVASQAVWP